MTGVQFLFSVAVLVYLGQVFFVVGKLVDADVWGRYKSKWGLLYDLIPYVCWIVHLTREINKIGKEP